MAFDNIDDKMLNDFSKIEVISSPEMTVENENRLLDKVELWSSSDNDGPNRKKAKMVLRHDKKKMCGIRRNFKKVVETSQFLKLKKRLKFAEELMDHINEGMVQTKYKPLVGKMIKTFKNGGGTFLLFLPLYIIQMILSTS